MFKLIDLRSSLQYPLQIWTRRTSSASPTHLSTYRRSNQTELGYALDNFLNSCQLLIHRTEHILKTLNPVWQPFTLSMAKLCGNNQQQGILFQVHSYHRSPQCNRFMIGTNLVTWTLLASAHALVCAILFYLMHIQFKTFKRQKIFPSSIRKNKPRASNLPMPWNNPPENIPIQVSFTSKSNLIPFTRFWTTF